MEVDDLLVHLGGEAVVHEESDGAADHEGEVGGQIKAVAPDQQEDDADGQDHVEEEQLGTGQFILRLLSNFFQLHVAFNLGQFAVEAGAALLFLETGEHGVGQSKDDTENLDRQDGLPEAAGLNAEDGGGTHGGAGPGHQVQHAHRQHRDAQQRGLAHMHALEDGQHGGDNDAEGGGTAAVQVADQRDDGGHHAHADDTVAHQFHELVDDDVEHARVRHDAEVQHGEHEQGRGGAGAGKAGFDHGGEVFAGDAAADDQHQSQDRGPHDEGDGGLGLALEQGDDDGDDGQQTKNAN